MNAHTRHGLTSSDVIDYGRSSMNSRKVSGGYMVWLLSSAAYYRTSAATIDESGRRSDGVLTDMSAASSKHWARHYVERARAFRLKMLEVAA